MIRKATLRRFLTTVILTAAQQTFAGEPLAPPPADQPRTYAVELREEVAIHIGDSVSLKGTDFSAKLVGFREPVCAVSGPGCEKTEKLGPTPEFLYTYKQSACETNIRRTGKPASKPRGCLQALPYQVGHQPISDRAVVRARIEERPTNSRK